MYNYYLREFDRCGKGTLIDLYRKAHHNYKLSKMRVPRNTVEASDWYTELFVELMTTQSNGIWDRAHISEAVYAPLYKGYVDAHWPVSLWNMEQWLENSTVVIVYVYPVWSSLLKPDERFGADILRELDAYDEALAKTRLPVIRITKHETARYAWRNEQEVLYELESKLAAVLGS